MKAKQINYSRLKSVNYDNQTIGIVLDVEENESAEETLKRAKNWVSEQFGEEIKEEYEVDAHCDNCGMDFDYHDYLKLKYGEEIRNSNCPRCGCQTLRKP